MWILQQDKALQCQLEKTAKKNREYPGNIQWPYRPKILFMLYITQGGPSCCNPPLFPQSYISLPGAI
jgi:hypothetical protein